MAEEEKKELEETGEADETSVPPVPPVPPDEADAKSEVEAPAEPEQPAAEDKPAEPDWKALYALTLADFDNYKKRAARDREDTFRFAEMDILKDVLPAVDNLELALSNAKEKAEDPFVQGVKLVYDGLLKALEKHGATPIDSVGEPFNADYHEAVAQLPSQDVEEGVITNEVLRGWLLHGKLLRAAKVVVSSGKGA